MKKRVLLGAVVAAAFGLTAPAFAQDVETPIGTVSVTNNGTGGSIAADGNADNPDPADGFVSASGDATDPANGSLCADDNGSPDDGNPENGAESETPTCVEDQLP